MPDIEKPKIKAPAKEQDDIPYFPKDEYSEGDANPLYFSEPTTAFLVAYHKHGPIWRTRLFNAERVAMGGLEANRFIWGNNDLWDYRETNKIFREQFSDRYLNQLDGEEYTKKRRRTNMGFKPSMLMSHTPAMSEVLLKEIDKLNGERTELRLFCMRIMIAMTSQALLQEELPEGMDETMAISNKEMLRASSLGWKRWLWYWNPGKRKRRRIIFDFLGSVIDRRTKEGAGKDDTLSMILAAHPDSEPPIPRGELIHDLSQLMMGGSTTTSMLIMWTLLHIYNQSSWRASVLDELKYWDPAGFTTIDPYPRLRASVLETERRRPGVPAFNRVAAQDFEFGGYKVKAGSDVLHVHTITHFLEDFYDDPMTWDPRRFLDNPDLPQRDTHGTYGGGSHKCVGQPLARIIPPLAIANILTHYNVEFEQTPSMEEKYDSVVAPREDEVWVRFKRK